MSIIDDMIADGVNIGNFQEVIKYFFDRGKVNDDEFTQLKNLVDDIDTQVKALTLSDSITRSEAEQDYSNA